MSANFYELLKYAATGIASPDMTYYDRMRASTLMGGATVQTLTGQPPLTFKADGTPLISWSMKGNGSQQGTPTPDNPVMPEFVGVKTVNLLDFDALKTAPQEVLGTYRFSHVLTLQLKPNTDYTLYADGAGSSTGTPDENRCIYFNGSDTPNVVYDGAPKTENSGNDGILKIGLESSRTNAQQYLNGDAHVWLIEGTTPLPYEPYGYKIPLTCAGQTVPVYLGQTQTVRKIRKLVLDGTENWQWSTGDQAGYVYLAIANSLGYAVQNTEICSHFQSNRITGSNTAQGIGVQNKSAPSSMTAILIRYTGLSTDAATFKAYLAAQYAAGTPVTVWYVLATPQTSIVNEPLAKIGDYPDELHSTDAGIIIPTAKGENTLTVYTDLQPSKVSITGSIKE